MSETFAKRARAQLKKMTRESKAERKKARREQALAQPASDVVDPSYFFDEAESKAARDARRSG
jgi:hypothetical protein